MVLVRQNTLIYLPISQGNLKINAPSCYRPAIALFLVIPEWITRQQAKCYACATVMSKKQASLAIQTVALALGKRQVFCTLK
jgi:hypothetical protein